jgi:hypothetical protein
MFRIGKGRGYFLQQADIFLLMRKNQKKEKGSLLPWGLSLLFIGIVIITICVTKPW